MTRVRLCAVSVFLFACKPGGTTPPTTDGDAAASGPGGPAAPRLELDATGPIVAVVQRTLPLTPYTFQFDATGRLLATEFEDAEGGTRCGIWDVETDTFLREVELDADDEDAVDPCYDWTSDPYETVARSADGQLEASLAGALVIVGPGDRTRQLADCRTCDGVLAWAPSGHRLATSNGEIIEIWDADSGQRIHSEALGLSEVSEVMLGWSEDGIGLAVTRTATAPCSELEDEDYCAMYWGYDYDEYDDEEESDEAIEEEMVDGVALSSFFWPSDGGPTIVELDRFMGLDMSTVQTDEGVRWLAFTTERGYDREGVTTTLHVLGTDARTSAMDETEFDGANEEYVEPWNGHWRVDASTQWLEGWSRSSGFDGVALGWTAIVTEPDPASYSVTVVEDEGYGAYGEIEVFGAASGVALTRWESCNDEDGDCKSVEVPVGDCELLDVAPQLSLALVDCEDSLRLTEASGRGNTFAKLGFDSSAEWQWGRGNYLALVDPGTKLAVIDLANGKTLYERAGVEELLAVPLASEQDRLALVYEDRLEIVAGATGAKVVAVTGDWEAAALSPDGRSIAVLANKRAKVIDVESGAERSSFAVDDQFGLAWRQDGAALFYGYDWPTHAVDPNTGALLYELDDPILDVLDLEEVDPSWRWIHRPDGSITRTLDFARIEIGPTWVRLASGQFDGKLEDLPDDLRFRVGDDPSAAPRYSARDLEPWLRVPGLAARFFSGAEVPSPAVPAEAKAQR